MPDYIIILGEEEELLDLANALNEKYCSGNASILMYNQLQGGQQPTIDKLFLVGHADIASIGRYQPEEVIGGCDAYLSAAQNIIAAGCSTGDAKQQVLRGGFLPGKPLLGKLKQKYGNKHIFGTPGALVLYNGALTTEGGLSQGATSDTIFVEYTG